MGDCTLSVLCAKNNLCCGCHKYSFACSNSKANKFSVFVLLGIVSFQP